LRVATGLRPIVLDETVEHNAVITGLVPVIHAMPSLLTMSSRRRRVDGRTRPAMTAKRSA
jgi:hypothetical protein